MPDIELSDEEEAKMVNHIIGKLECAESVFHFEFEVPPLLVMQACLQFAVESAVRSGIHFDEAIAFMADTVTDVVLATNPELRAKYSQECH